MEQKIKVDVAQTSSDDAVWSASEEVVKGQEEAQILVGGSATDLANADETAAPISLIEFPCHFPVKVLGASVDDFMDDIVSTVRRLDPIFDAACIEQRASRTGRYTGLTCTVYAKNKAHLDDIYRALTAHPKVAYVL